jgi:hypothetical protein
MSMRRNNPLDIERFEYVVHSDAFRASADASYARRELLTRFLIGATGVFRLYCECGG